MCKFNKKSESCNITMNDMDKLDHWTDIVLLEEHNRLVATLGNIFTKHY